MGASHAHVNCLAQCQKKRPAWGLLLRSMAGYAVDFGFLPLAFLPLLPASR